MLGRFFFFVSFVGLERRRRGEEREVIWTLSYRDTHHVLAFLLFLGLDGVFSSGFIYQAINHGFEW
jgi:hypothetical protein